MKVAYDSSTLNKPWLSGMGVWMVQVYQAMRPALSSELQLQPICRASRWKQRSIMQKHLNDHVQLYLPFFGDKGFDVFHGPDFRLPDSVKIPRVVSIPDIAFYEEGMTSPDFAAKKISEVENLLKKQKPESVIVISEYTKNEVLKRFPEYESRIHVTLLGHEHLLVNQRETLPPPEEHPYLLFVGNLEARKNVIRVLQAFDQLCESHPDVDERLILIGRPGFDYKNIEHTLRGMKNKDRVILKGYVENQQLVAYYRHARAFVYPSLIEGFGIPLLEAMLNECPIVTANVTATAEVTKEAALQVDPLKVDEIEHAMYRLLSDQQLVHTLVKKGKALVGQYSWKKCAAETIEIYKKVLN